MSTCYQSIVANLSQASEVVQPYQYFTERHLQAVWLEQKYFRQLHTLDGEPINVLSPGIWNGDAGPDFRKAHLKIGAREYRGDIELHLTEESWKNHGHSQDERYNDVILHISLWKPKQEISILTQNGRVVLQTYFERHLTISPAKIVQLIDLDLYPYKKFIGSGKCAHALFKNLPEIKVITLFKEASKWRLEQKRNHLKIHVDNPHALLGAGIAMALGYKKNSKVFLELFNALQQYKHFHEDTLLAIAMDSCNFFSEKFVQQWSKSGRYIKLLELSKEHADAGQKTYKLELNQIRPLNHPLRRLVFLVKLIKDPSLETRFGFISSLWHSHWKKCRSKRSWRELCREMRSLIPTYTDEYWNHHFNFELSVTNDSLSLCGDSLKNAIIVNTILPLLQEEVMIRADRTEMLALESFYNSMPSAGSGKTRYLVHRFFGDSAKGKVLDSADTEQGAYQLHRDFCIHYEASCEGCPFVDRYLSTSS